MDDYGKNLETALEYIEFNILQYFAGGQDLLFRSSFDYDVLESYDQLMQANYPLRTSFCTRICLEVKNTWIVTVSVTKKARNS